MRPVRALLTSAVVLAVILVSTIATAIVFTPIRGVPTTGTVIAKTTKTLINTTELTVSLAFPNGTKFLADRLYAGRKTGTGR